MADFDPAAVRHLERHVSEVASGAPSRFVLLLAAEAGSAGADFDELEKLGSSKALFVRVPDGPASFEERSCSAVVARLSERRNGRPGMAVLVDALIARSAEHVMGPDLATIQVYLTPEELDDTPAVASRVLVQRFLPSLLATWSDVKQDLLEALLRERTGSLEGRPGVAEVLARRSRSEALAELGALAKHGGVAVVVGLGCSSEHAAAPALEVSGTTPRTGSFVFTHGVLADLWAAEGSLLSDEERKRVELNSVRHAKPVIAPTPPVVTVVTSPVLTPPVVTAPVVPPKIAEPPTEPPKPSAALAPAPVAPLAPPAPVAPVAIAMGSAPRRDPATSGPKRALLYVLPAVVAVTLAVIAWNYHGGSNPVPAPPSDVAPTPSATAPPTPVPVEPVGNPAPAVRPLLEKARGVEQRLQILDGLFAQTKPADCVAAIADLLAAPPGPAAEASTFRVGLLVRLAAFMKVPASVALAVEWTKTDKGLPERLAALDALAKAPALTAEARAQLERLAAGDSWPKVQARARELIGAGPPRR